MPQNCGVATGTDPLRDLVDLVVEEVVAGVKVPFAERALAYEAVRHLALDVHHQLQHLVVRLARKQDLAGVQLKQRHARRPQVDAVVVPHPDHCTEFTAAAVTAAVTAVRRHSEKR